MRTINTLLLLACLVSSGSRPAHAADSIPWAKDLRTAQETASQSRRLVLLHFWAPNCAPCQALERFVFPHPEVVRAINANYVPVYINAQVLPELAKRFGVDRWPTDVIVTPEGEVLSRAVSPKDANQYVTLLNRTAASQRPAQDSKWGELAKKEKPQTPDYQSNPYQSAGNSTAAQGNPYAGKPNQGGPGGEFQEAARYQPNRPTETTLGSGQYGATPDASDPRGLTAASAAGRSTPSGNNSRFDPSPRGGPGTAAERVAAGQYNGQVAAPDVATGFITNPQFNPSGTRKEPSGAAASGGGEFNSHDDVASQEWTEQNPLPTKRGTPKDPPRSPAGKTAGEHRQVTGVEPAPPPMPLALEGYCPVTLIESQNWKRGTADFGAVHRGRTYLFTGKREQTAFLADPDRFSPVLSGYDPVNYRESGELVEGKRQFGVFYGDQIFLFANKASRDKFEASPDSFAKDVHEAMLHNAVGNRRR